jgi:hypothetical protein
MAKNRQKCHLKEHFTTYFVPPLSFQVPSWHLKFTQISKKGLDRSPKQS